MRRGNALGDIGDADIPGVAVVRRDDSRFSMYNIFNLRPSFVVRGTEELDGFIGRHADMSCGFQQKRRSRLDLIRYIGFRGDFLSIFQENHLNIAIFYVFDGSTLEFSFGILMPVSLIGLLTASYDG